MVIFKGREFDAVRTNEDGEDEYLYDGEWMTEEDMDEMEYFLNDYTRAVRRANGDADDPDFDDPDFEDDDFEDDDFEDNE
ncbi:hypothetical protein [Porphyromonas sp.]